MTDHGSSPANAPATASRAAASPAAASPATAERAGLYGSVGQNVATTTAAEFIGTFVLVFAGTAAAVSAALQLPIAGAPADSLTVALAFGLALVAMVYTLGHVSGCHLNPAVTLGLAVTGKLPWSYVPTYIVGQLAGASTASLAVWGLFGDAAREEAGLGVTQPAAGVSGLTVVLMEAVVTFILVMVILSVATDQRSHPAVAGIAVGFTLAICVLIAGPLTGGAVNPARALGPMLVSGRFDDWWAYLVGPVVGGILGAVTYDRILSRAAEPGSTENLEQRH